LSEQRDIGWRLENWARIYRDTHRGGISATAAFCDQLRREKEGDTSPPERRRTDEEDAALIESCMQRIDRKHSRMLWWCYVKQAHPGEVCRAMSIPHRPATVFVAMFRAAQHAIETAVERDQKFHDVGT
jgi:DNA-directed RNA polymerase specialized sigma24 family protein